MSELFNDFDTELEQLNNVVVKLQQSKTIAIPFMSAFDSIHSWFIDEIEPEYNTSINLNMPETTFYFGKRSDIEYEKLIGNAFLGYDFIHDIQEISPIWKTINNKKIAAISIKYIEQQISENIEKHFRHDEYYQFYYTKLNEMLTSIKDEIRVFALWLMTHENIMHIINRFFLDIFYMLSFTDTQNSNFIDLNVYRPDRKYFPNTSVFQLAKEFNKTSAISQATMYIWNNFTNSELSSIWSNYLIGHDLETNPFYILQKEIYLTFGTGENELTQNSVIEFLTFSKLYFVYFIFDNFRIPKNIEKMRSKIFRLWI